MAAWSFLLCSFPLLWCVFAGYSDPTPESALGGSYIDCPCLDVESHVETRNILNKYRQPDQTFRVAGGFTVPAGYGNAQCIAWDKRPLRGDPRCLLLPVAPGYCDDAWCFVNSSECSRDTIDSQAFPGLTLSYHTCGSVGYQVRSQVTLDNITVRIYIPGEYPLDADSKAEKEFLRSMIQFAVPVLQTAGVQPDNIVYQKLSNASRRMFPKSDYSACIWDTVINNIDLCIGDFWDTPARRNFGGLFTASITEETFYFYGTLPVADPLTFGDIIVAPFRPFTGDTWAMLLCVTVLAGFAFCCFERLGISGEEQGEEIEETQGWFSRLRSIVESVGDGAYFGLASFTSGAAIEFEAKTCSGRVVIVGFSIFITICIASFTANTASLLVAKAIPKLTVTDFESAIKLGEPVAMPNSFDQFYEQFDEKFGQGWMRNVKNFTGTSYCLQKVDSGEFQYVTASELSYRVERTKGRSCSSNVLGMPLTSVPTGYFASQDVYRGIGEAITIEKQRGTWQAIFENIYGGDACPPSDDASFNENTQLTPENMAGTCLVLFFFFLFALVIRVAQLVLGFLRLRSRPSVSSGRDRVIPIGNVEAQEGKRVDKVMS